MSAPSHAALSAHLVGSVGRLPIDVALEAAHGPLVIVGPNGAGKTSLLLMLLGVIAPRRGHVSLGGASLFDSEAGVDVPVEARRIGYVPQDYALFPHRDVIGNVALALASAHLGLSRRERSDKALAMLHTLGVDHLAQRRPDTLSGGEKQRVALARALSVEPRALVLDEPLAALDVHARREVRAFLSGWLRQLAIPTLIVTHDPEDARTLGERIVVLEQGQVVQSGPWDELAQRPATAFVAELVRPLQRAVTGAASP